MEKKKTAPTCHSSAWLYRPPRLYGLHDISWNFDIQGPKRMTHSDFYDSLTFSLGLRCLWTCISPTVFYGLPYYYYTYYIQLYNKNNMNEPSYTPNFVRSCDSLQLIRKGSGCHLRAPALMHKFCWHLRSSDFSCSITSRPEVEVFTYLAKHLNTIAGCDLCKTRICILIPKPVESLYFF